MVRICCIQLPNAVGIRRDVRPESPRMGWERLFSIAGGCAPQMPRSVCECVCRQFCHMQADVSRILVQSGIRARASSCDSHAVPHTTMGEIRRW
jgi:hypothetical protein